MLNLQTLMSGILFMRVRHVEAGDYHRLPILFPCLPYALPTT